MGSSAERCHFLKVSSKKKIVKTTYIEIQPLFYFILEMGPLKKEKDGFDNELLTILVRSPIAHQPHVTL